MTVEPPRGALALALLRIGLDTIDGKMAPEEIPDLTEALDREAVVHLVADLSILGGYLAVALREIGGSVTVEAFFTTAGVRLAEESLGPTAPD